ncbi:hypothetical protein [Streptomyces sp. NPDC007000]|uniref:hypothetical protein n=1 Tax=unclassified Streptomyces TaxID=2593676 RepID=UPI0033E2214C
MSAIDQLLARARLHHRADVPDDTVPHDDGPLPDPLPAAAPPAGPGHTDPATARQLHTLCETAVAALTHDVLAFLTDQVPDHHSAWLLGCALHLAGIEEGARFWWQYAAGDGHRPACYTLSLHHHVRGEQHAAAFYAQQTGLDLTSEAGASETLPVAGACPPTDFRFDAGLSTVLRILSELAAPGHRRRPHRIDALTNYVADAVTPHYSRHPNIELPVPEPRFADRVGFLLSTTPPWTPRTRTPRTPRATAPTLPVRTDHCRNENSQDGRPAHVEAPPPHSDGRSAQASPHAEPHPVRPRSPGPDTNRRAAR